LPPEDDTSLPLIEQIGVSNITLCVKQGEQDIVLQTLAEYTDVSKTPSIISNEPIKATLTGDCRYLLTVLNEEKRDD
jgi:hypothetical protein